jgi:mRNA-degrading endonuclease RelE of RelBE toxin-antitoxin system
MTDFRIATSFTDSLGRLTSQEQKAVKTTAFDLQMNPSSPGLSFHKLDRAQDKNFWSVRVNSDIRIIVHRTVGSLLLAYVDHHDGAYHWAERRRLERHPTTGAMQIVEVRELVEEVAPTVRIHEGAPIKAAAPEEVKPPKQKLFDNLTKIELMSFGVPADWIADVRGADEDNVLDVLAHLPEEAREALLKIAVGDRPEPPAPIPPEQDPYEHPDAQRRFRIMTNAEELRLALEYPWEKWAVFLHPAQAVLTTRNFNGPARVTGSAGTGKTIVALHRAVTLARKYPDKRVLLTTFSKALSNALRRKLILLAGEDTELLNRITVDALNNVAYDLYKSHFGQPSIAPQAVVEAVLAAAAKTVEGHKFALQFIITEWTDVIDAWQVGSWESYRDVTRLGRKTRVGGKQREILWAIFEQARKGLEERKVVTWADIFVCLSESLAGGMKLPFDFAVVDECQDLDVAQARLLAQFGGTRENVLFFAGDFGQQIFQLPFSWKELGLDVRGRSSTLRINYRTSQQIRTQADKLLPSEISDVDGIKDVRRGTISLFEGPPPAILTPPTVENERDTIARWIKDRLADGVQPAEIAVFVRSQAEMKRARDAVKAADCEWVELTDKAEAETGKVSISTMHLAKGHEFKTVVVMACDEDVLPSAERIGTVGDEAELEAIFNTERHLLYVACTRARDNLLVTGIHPGSIFLTDLK